MGRRFFVMIDGECDVYEAGDLESAGGRMPGAHHPRCSWFRALKKRVTRSSTSRGETL